MLMQLLRALIIKLGTTIGLTSFMGIERADARRLIVCALFVAVVAFLLAWSLKLTIARGA